MKLIKCPKCGEMYSDSYRTCPFCQEDAALKGRAAAPRRKFTRRRRAPSILGPAMVLVVVLAAVLGGIPVLRSWKLRRRRTVRRLSFVRCLHPIVYCLLYFQWLKSKFDRFFAKIVAKMFSIFGRIYTFAP